ncbi:helix-turn-helix domain-containing protein [Micromonospora chalcea]|uniref:helix-turn-helix domain-containing protein n=1 Tax=Micromonospora chalcea TaxID=1874 RepID=UPI0033C19AC6
MANHSIPDRSGKAQPRTLIQLAADLGVTQEVVRAALQELGVEAKSSKTRLTPAIVRLVRSMFRNTGIGIPVGDKRIAKSLVAPPIDETSSAHQELAKALRALRSNEGRTLRAVAEKTGYSASSLSDAENGVTLPRWSLVEKVVTHLNGDLDKFKKLHQAALYESSARHSHPMPLQGIDEGLSFADEVSISNATFGMIVKGIQSDALSAMFEQLIPDPIMTAFASIWSSQRDSKFDTTLFLSRWIVEAICSDKGLGDVTAARGIRLLQEMQHINEPTTQWGLSIIRMANEVVHGARSAGREEADSVVAFATVLLAQIYVVNEQLSKFQHDK